MSSVLIPTDQLLASARMVVLCTKQAQALHSCLIKGRVFLEIKKLPAFYRVIHEGFDVNCPSKSSS